MGKGKAIKNNNNTSKNDGEKTGAGKRSNSKPKFKGNCANLEGHAFDCSDQQQANKFITMFKWIEHVGVEHCCGGDICSTLEN